VVGFIDRIACVAEEILAGLIDRQYRFFAALFESIPCLGILLTAAADVRIAGNRVIDVGPQARELLLGRLFKRWGRSFYDEDCIHKFTITPECVLGTLSITVDEN
jgi:hypothetical protein